MKGLTPILKEVLLRVKYYQTALHPTEKSFAKRRVSQCGKLHYRILGSCHSHANSDQSAVNKEAKPSISKKIRTC